MENLKLDLNELENLALVGGNDKDGRIAVETSLAATWLSLEATKLTYGISIGLSWWNCK